jgi:hypothetical protein
MPRSKSTIIFILVLCLLIFGCKENNKKKNKHVTQPATLPPVEVKAQVDRAVATTGDEITYSVTLNYDPQVKILSIPEFGADIGGFRVIDIGEDEPREVEERIKVRKWYKLKADLIGSYVLPPVTISYEYKNEKKEVKTAKIFVEIKSVLDKQGAPKDIKDIKPLAKIERDLKKLYLIISGITLMLGLVGGGLFFYWRKRKKAEDASPPRPAHELALEELEALKQKNLIEKGQVRLHYFELSEIFRRYLERRFFFPAVESTTEEIIREFRKRSILNQQTRSIAQVFLKNTDRVKFAKYNPSAEEIEKDHSDALNFIKQTMENSKLSINNDN